MTALFLRLDTNAHTIEAVNAGHNPGLLFQNKSKHPILLEASGTNGHKELFGFERVRAISTQTAAQIADAAKQFGQEDDITVVTIQRLAVPTYACATIALSAILSLVTAAQLRNISACQPLRTNDPPERGPALVPQHVQSLI